MNTDIIHAAGVLYNRERLGNHSRKAGGKATSPLRRFAEALIRDGIRVGGVVQETLFDETGAKCGIDAIDLRTGDRVPINRNTPEQLENKVCTLDNQKLADVSSLLRASLEAEGIQILLVEKFGEQEQTGRGLATEILAAMERGIPILVAVPEAAEALWRDFTGGLAPLIPAEDAALARWWEDTRQGLSD